MYVDKKLKGIKIVQSLSRLNRTREGKTDTLVVDFKNTADEIEEGYSKYYKGTSLIDKTTSDYIFKLFCTEESFVQLEAVMEPLVGKSLAQS